MFKNIHRCGYEVNSENKINLDDYLEIFFGKKTVVFLAIYHCWRKKKKIY